MADTAGNPPRLGSQPGVVNKKLKVVRNIPTASPHAEAPAVLIVRDGADFALLTIGGSQREIDRILWVMNPVKLASIALVAHTAHEPSTRDACS
jgi:hypothetical protein